MASGEGEKFSETQKRLYREVAKFLLESEENYEPVKIVLGNNEELEARAFKSQESWIIVPLNLKFMASYKEEEGVDRIVPLE